MIMGLVNKNNSSTVQILPFWIIARSIQRRRQFQQVFIFSSCIKTLFKSKVIYNVGSICTNVPVQLENELISTEIRFNIQKSRLTSNYLGTNTVIVKRLY